MNNDDFDPITESLLALLPYNSEIIFPDGKTYRKEFSAEDLEWTELDGRWRDSPRKASARLTAEYSEAQIWAGDHKNTNHKYVTGDRLDHIEAEAKRLVGQSQQSFSTARTQDDLLNAKMQAVRAQGMNEALRMVRGYHEGI
jgi:hypothetical protein